MVYSIIVALLTNGWTESIYTAQVKMIMSVEHMRGTKVLITASLSSMATSGLIMVLMRAGGGMTHF